VETFRSSACPMLQLSDWNLMVIYIPLPVKTSHSVLRLCELTVCQRCRWSTLLVAKLVEVLRYKPEGRGFDSRWCHNISGRSMALGSTQPVTDISNRNISWGLKAASAYG